MWSTLQKRGCIIWKNSVVFFWQRKITQHLSPGLNSLIWPQLSWNQPIVRVVVEVHVKVASLLSSFMHLSGLLWRCPASMKNISVLLEWCCPARAFSRALSFWPRSTTRSGTHSICTSMKSFHAIRKEIKSEGLLATFFFFPPTASQRRAGTMEALGCCSPRLRRTAETHSIIMRACRLWSNLLRMIHIVSITDPAASR